MDLSTYLTMERTKEFSVPPNFRYGEATYGRGAVELIFAAQ